MLGGLGQGRFGGVPEGHHRYQTLSEADYVNPAFSGEMPVPETARKLATFMNDALAKEKG